MVKWPKERQEELEERRLNGERLEHIAKSLHPDMKVQMVSYHLKHIQPRRALFDALPDQTKETLRIPDRPCALTADWHSPITSMKWLTRLLKVSHKLKIRDVAIVGDLMDNHHLSKYLSKDHSYSWDDELDLTLQLITRLLEEFDDVWWCYGNHEDRVPAAMKGCDPLTTMVKHIASTLPGKMHMSHQAAMYLGEDWLLVHPKMFSRDGAKTAVDIAAIQHKNVATGHGHHFGMKMDISGKYVGLDLGGLFEADKTSYLFDTGMTNMPNWQPGFWTYAHGKVRPFADAFVNWAEFEAE